MLLKWGRMIIISLVLAKMKNLTISIILVSIEPAWNPEFKQFTKLKIIENWASYGQKIVFFFKFHYGTNKCLFWPYSVKFQFFRSCELIWIQKFISVSMIHYSISISKFSFSLTSDFLNINPHLRDTFSIFVKKYIL